MTKWLTDNKTAITTLKLEKETNVSTHAIVLDVSWKAAFKTPIRRSVTNTVSTIHNNYQAVGTRGDTIAVYITMKNNPYN